jgi:hypothetical protein
MTPQELEDKKKAAERQAELSKLEPIDFVTLRKIINEWMLVADDGIVKLLPAILVANRLKRDPIWVFLIGPSGGGKTEFLNALFDIPDIYPISTLTPSTFLSGMPGRADTSLLPIISGKVLAFLDWTNLLSMNKDARNEILGQLRDIYGGHMKKIFGTGKIAEWRGKIGIMACTTSVIDFQQQANAALGERFIHYRIAMPERKEVARRALNNGEHQDEMRIKLRNAFYAFMKGVQIPEEIPTLATEYQDEIIKIANFSTMARSGVIRDFGPKREVMFVPATEMPTRIVQQLNTLAASFVIINKGEFLEEDMEVIYKIALDSIPQTNRMVMLEMARRAERTTAEIATSLGYPTAPIRMYLENLALLGVCRRIRGAQSEEGGNADKWTLNEEFTEILRKHEAVQEIIEVEEKAPANIDPALSFEEDNAQGGPTGLGI